jgi:ABC-2 type transport system permease protein
LVAGDIVAAEDHNRTLKTILTRSTSRSSIFAAKVVATFAYVLGAMLAMGVAGTIAGGLASGFDSLPTFSTVISPSRALALVAGSFAIYSLPVLGLAAIGILLSTTSRNSAAAVVRPSFARRSTGLRSCTPPTSRPSTRPPRSSSPGCISCAAT